MMHGQTNIKLKSILYYNIITVKFLDVKEVSNQRANVKY